MKDEALAEIDKISEEMAQEILRVVRIDSIKSEPQKNAPFGKGVRKALNRALELAEGLGFETVNVDNYVGYAKYGGDEDYIGVTGHLDVVETGEGWTHPPFSGYTDENGRIFSRGILDNKGPILSCLYALYTLKRLHIPLSKQVRIMFGTDEENGFEDLTYYLSKEKPPIMRQTPGCEYPVMYGERSRTNLQIHADQAHLRQFFSFVTTYFLESAASGGRLGIDYHDGEYGEMQIHGYALHAEQEDVVFQFTLSYPACCSIQDIQKQIRTGFDSCCALQLLHNHDPVRFEKDCFMVRALQSAYEQVSGLDGTPVTTTGGTCAKAMPNIVPLGPSFLGQKGIGHQPDEWMDIKDTIMNVKIYALGLYKLVK